MELNVDVHAPQRRYARWLSWTTRVALALLVIAFAAYLLGLAPAHVPIDSLPGLWNLPASQFLERTGVKPGWGWATYLPGGDMLVLAAIGLLISSSILCLAAIVPLFHKRREPLFVAICVLQIAVLAIAASGVFSIR
jgi:hypothetical protein